MGDKGTILKMDSNSVQTELLNNTLNINNLKIYPNPNDGNFNFEFPNPNNRSITISIIDLKGNTIFETTSFQNEYIFDGKDLCDGVYFVRIQGINCNYRKIFVKE